MEFIEQTKNLKLTIVENPRVFISWDNTEDGRDKTDCYERIDNNILCYVNCNNTNIKIFKGEEFFETLEILYYKLNK